MTQSRLMRRTGPWSILDSATAAASASRSAPPTFIRPTGEAACAGIVVRPLSAGGQGDAEGDARGGMR